MSEAFKTTIAQLREQIATTEAELSALKTTVNVLSRQIGEGEVYDDVAAVSAPAQAKKSSAIKLRMDEYFGRPLATCVVDVLERRKTAGDGPATVAEIFEVLSAGGYKFEGTSGNDENTKRSLKSALSKNTSNFVKLKDDIFGLRKWYGGKVRRVGMKDKSAGNGEPDETEDPLDKELREFPEYGADVEDESDQQKQTTLL